MIRLDGADASQRRDTLGRSELANKMWRGPIARTEKRGALACRRLGNIMERPRVLLGAAFEPVNPLDSPSVGTLHGVAGGLRAGVHGGADARRSGVLGSRRMGGPSAARAGGAGAGAERPAAVAGRGAVPGAPRAAGHP